MGARSVSGAGELMTRTVAGAVLAATALAAVGWGGLLFAALVALVAALGRWEWGGLVGEPRARRLRHALALPAVVVVTAVVDARYGLAALGLLLLAALAGSARGALHGHSGWRATLAGTLYVGLPAVALVGLRGTPHGLALVLFVFAVVWATDVAAFLAGRAVGGPRLWPAVSPSKTWAGLAGGVAAAAAAGAGVALWQGWSVRGAAAVGAALALVAQAGDLFESHLKRRAGVKDLGRLIPGHGGVLDRVDGLVPVATVVGAAVLVAGLAPSGGGR